MSGKRPTLLWLVPLGVALLLLLVGVLHVDAPLARGELIDADDYLHLVQSERLMAGEGWHDYTVDRLDPFRGTEVRYARLVDGTLGVLTAAISLIVPHAEAQLVTAAIVPIILMLVFAAGLIWTLKPLVPMPWPYVAAAFIPAAEFLALQFQPGRTDHHGWQLTFMIWMIGAAQRLMLEPRRKVWPVLLAFLMALSLWTGGETLPWLTLILAYLLGMAAFARPLLLPPLLTATSLLTLFAVVIMLLIWPPGDFLAVRTTSFSFAHVCIAAFFALIAGIAHCFRNHPQRVFRLTVVVAAALVLGFFYLCLFPVWLGGPYGANSESFAGQVLANVSETEPLFLTRFPWMAYLVHLTLPIAALFGLIGLWQKIEHRPFAALLFILLIATLCGGGFGQMRVMAFVSPVALIGVGCLLYWLDRHLQPGWPLHPRTRQTGIALLMVIGLTALSVTGPYALRGDGLAFAVSRIALKKTAERCDMRPALAWLNAPERQDKALHVAASLYDGTRILLQTDHAVFSAPYDAARGNRLISKLFTTRDMREASHLMAANGIDAVLVCRILPTMYWVNRALYEGPPKSGAELDIWLDHSGLAERLVFGRSPKWLTPVPLQPDGNYSLYLAGY